MPNNFRTGLVPAPLQVQAPANVPTIAPIPLNTQLNFEQRVLNPSQYPALPLGKGNLATHMMSWGGADGQQVAFPTIVQTPSGNLVQLKPEEAFRYAMQTRQFRGFSTPEEASNYAEGGYKQSWGAGESPSLNQVIQKLGK